MVNHERIVMYKGGALMIYFFWALISFLAVVGGVDVFRKLIFWLYKPKKTIVYMGAVINHIDDAENTVRSIVERLKWMELGLEVKIIIIDRTGDEKVNDIVQKIIYKFPNVSLLS